jgi:hypothetical protein
MIDTLVKSVTRATPLPMAEQTVFNAIFRLGADMFSLSRDMTGEGANEGFETRRI